jgi:hypothetical protein
MVARAKYRKEDPDPDQALRVLAQILATRLAGSGLSSIDAGASSDSKLTAEDAAQSDSAPRARDRKPGQL